MSNDVCLPNLQCLRLDVGYQKFEDVQKLILYDLDEYKTIIHLEDTPSNERLLKTFAYIMDNKVRYHRDQAFEDGKREGYAERSMEVKRTLEGLLNPKSLMEF